jgi:predicted negative regulator of RcsB-dependent stress response
MMDALYSASWVHYHRGDSEAATETAEAAVALGRAQGFSVWPEYAVMLLARLKVDQGRVDEGVAQAEEALPRITALGWTWGAVFSSALLAGAYGKAGQPQKGLDILGTLATRNFEGFYEPELLRLRGELLLARTPEAHATAESCFRRAIELAQTRQEKSLELRAVMSRYRLSRVHGRRDEARELLARTLAWFVEGFDTADLREARARLEELS